MGNSVLTLVTNRAKQRFQEAIRRGFSVKVSHFVVGNQGHDPDSYITALSPDPFFDPNPDSAGNRLPPDAVVSPTAITSAVDDPDFATIYTCYLAKGDATGVISSIYLIAKVTSATDAEGVATPDPGLWFVWSVGYLPARVKLETEDLTFRVGVQY